MLLFPALSLSMALLQGPMGTWDELPVGWNGAALGDGYGVGHISRSIPDLDSDGLADVIIGGNRFDAVGGMVQIHSTRDGSIIRQFVGQSPFDQFGISVSLSPDEDFDGSPEILVSAIGEDFPGGSGSVYLLSAGSGTQLKKFLGAPGDFSFGTVVMGLGDITNDGVPDFAVGIGASQRFPLPTGGLVALSGADGSEIYQIQEASVVAGVGALVGDINLDGVDDFLHGGATGTFLHSGIDGSVIRFHAAPRSNEGYLSTNAAAGLGDLNHDGIPEYAVGAHFSLTRRSVGHAYVYNGADGTLLYEIGGVHLDSRFGASISAAGDVDGDGFLDFIVGAPNETYGWQSGVPEPGAFHVFSGIDGTRIFSKKGKLGYTLGVGTSVLGLGDIDGNGLADLLVGSSANIGVPNFNGIWRTYGLQSYLNISPRTISASAGGTLTFNLDFPDEMANQDYMILASNDAPGRTGFYSVQIPLARNPFLNRMVLAPPAWLSGANGTLDTFGNATATATLAPGIAAPFANRTIRFSAVTFASPLDASNYSAGMRVRIEN